MSGALLLGTLSEADLVFPDENGMRDGQQANQSAVLQVLQNLMLSLDVAAGEPGERVCVM